MSIIDKSKINSEQERIQNMIEECQRLILKAKNKNKELSEKEAKIPKVVCLSNLKSPDSSTNTELSKHEELQQKIRYCTNCVLKLGEEVLP